MDCEAVTKIVHTWLVASTIGPTNANARAQPTEVVLQLVCSHTRAGARREERRLSAERVQSCRECCEDFAQHRPNRNLARLAEFTPANREHRLAQINVCAVQIDCFPKSQACPV